MHAIVLSKMQNEVDQGMNQKKEALVKAVKSIWNSLPILVGAVLLISLVKAIVPTRLLTTLFKNNQIIGPVMGSVLGSIFAGSPVTSYVIGGELLKQGVDLVTVTAFLIAWVTVGLLQLPAEAILLGKKFALTRNAVAFLLSLMGAFITAGLVSLL